MKKPLKIALIVLCVVFVVVFGVSAFKIISTLSGYKKAEKSYEQTSSQFTTVAAPAATPAGKEKEEDIPQAPLEKFPLKVDFNALRETCKDAVGWIYSPGTPINYPIVRTDDNVFYIEHLPDGDYSANGSIFVDCRNAGDFSNKNTVIYGHNMNDGSLFASLRNYRDASYYPTHPAIYICTPDKYYRLDIFAGVVTPADSYVYAFNFDTDEQFMAYVEMLKEESTFKSDVEVKPDDQTVVLSTCTYEVDDGRYVVVGKLTEIAPPEN